MLVSILIPCYNSSQFISETLDSVLAQTYTNWECIIVDDNSTDNSVEIVNTYCQKYPEKFKLYTNPRKGACAARNTAFEKSRGDYIQYLDADDLLDKRKIEIQIECAKKKSKEAVLFGEWYFFKNKISDYQEKKYKLFKQHLSSVSLLLTMWDKNLFLANCSYLYNRCIHPVNGWDEQLQRVQDGEFFTRLLINNPQCFYTKGAKCYYRIDSCTSITSYPTYEKIHSAYLAFLSYKNEISKINDSIKIRKLLAKHFSGLIYRHYLRYPEIVKLAQKEIEKLGVHPQPCGGKNFNLLVKILGFNNALKIKYRKIHL